jgi:hypothetical protein
MTGHTNDGPSLEQYLETRLNLLTKSVEEKLEAQNLRYQQRFEAQSDALTAAFLAQQTAMQTALISAEKAVQAALAAADRAVAKAETTSDKRFDGVNEFRGQLADQQRTFIPRAEVDILVRGLTEKVDSLNASLGGRISAIDKQLSERRAESAGVKGGYGYAVGIIGLVVTVLAILAWLATRFGG